MDSTTIRVGSAVRVTWPSTLAPVFHARYDGRVGVILEERGKMRTPQHGEEQLWLVDIDGPRDPLGSRRTSLGGTAA